MNDRQIFGFKSCLGLLVEMKITKRYWIRMVSYVLFFNVLDLGNTASNLTVQWFCFYNSKMVRN